MKTMRFLLLTLALGFLTIACQPTAQLSTPLVNNSNSVMTAALLPETDTPAVTATSTDLWITLLQHTPVPWMTPLPPETATILDATYVKINPRLATPFPCKRCPDYALEGGLWKFSLNKGTFRIYYTMNGWRSLGSYTVSGSDLHMFNDPYCNWETGHYTWKLEDGVLLLIEVNDPCSRGLRAANLTDQPWLSCEPPNIEAKITDHWQKPDGCDLDQP